MIRIKEWAAWNKWQHWHLAPQLNTISLIRAYTLWVLTAVAVTSIYTGKGQSEFPKMEKANLLRSSY